MDAFIPSKYVYEMLKQTENNPLSELISIRNQLEMVNEKMQITRSRML